MELLIDTWNVLHQSGVLPPESAGIGHTGLCRMIENSRWKGHKVALICDGTPSHELSGGVRYQTIFTGPFKSADEEIMERVARSSAPRSILVVTSDREIIAAISKRGAKHMGSSSFLQALVEDSYKPKRKNVHRPTGLSPELAQEWREQFGIDERVMEELQNTPMPIVQKTEPTKKESMKKEIQPKTKPKEERNVQRNEPALPADILEEARRLMRD
ncbi:MAG: NYN domain-containing protein [Planctomycetes bacterium]|nr:NYN domain-containing protein [Planctomycetota bacterium]